MIDELVLRRQEVLGIKVHELRRERERVSSRMLDVLFGVVLFILTITQVLIKIL